MPDMCSGRAIKGTRKDFRLIDAKLYTINIYKIVGIARCMLTIAIVICAIVYYQFASAAQLAISFALGLYSYNAIRSRAEIIRAERARNRAQHPIYTT